MALTSSGVSNSKLRPRLERSTVAPVTLSASMLTCTGVLNR
ncbi:Uncharacterised protein [Vibrio cholerae]|nr:Uncharacterised protein [Vibrio cholerae]